MNCTAIPTLILLAVAVSVHAQQPTGGAAAPVPLLCAEHVRQLEGESPFHNLMEVK